MSASSQNNENGSNNNYPYQNINGNRNNNRNMNNNVNRNMNNNVNRNMNNNVNGNMNNNMTGNVKFFLHKCPNCSAPIKVRSNMTSATCEYCGYTSLIAPSEMEQIQNRQIARSSNRKSNAILLTVLLPLLIVFSIGMLAAFGIGYKTSGRIALIQCICIVAGMIFGLGKKIHNARIGLLVMMVLLSFVLVIPYFAFMIKKDEESTRSAKEREEEKTLVTLDSSWPADGIGEVAPKPDLDQIHIWDNTDEGLSLKAKSVTEEFYEDYKEECINSGFIEFVKDYNNSYEAYTKDGYYVNVFLTEEGEFYLTVKAPIKMEKYLWPETGVGSLLPEPDNEYGVIVEDRNRSFEASVYNVSSEDFEAYIEACKEAGFTENISKTIQGFDAEDQDGNRINLFLFSDYYSTLRIAAVAYDEEE